MRFGAPCSTPRQRTVDLPAPDASECGDREEWSAGSSCSPWTNAFTGFADVGTPGRTKANADTTRNGSCLTGDESGSNVLVFRPGPSRPQVPRRKLRTAYSSHALHLHSRRRTTAFTCRARCKERDVSENQNSGPRPGATLCSAATGIQHEPPTTPRPCEARDCWSTEGLGYWLLADPPRRGRPTWQLQRQLGVLFLRLAISASTCRLHSSADFAVHCGAWSARPRTK